MKSGATVLKYISFFILNVKVVFSEVFYRNFKQKNQMEVNCIEFVFVDDVAHHSRVSRVDCAILSNHIHDFNCQFIRFTIINLYFCNNATEAIIRSGTMVSVHLIEVCIDIDYFFDSDTGYLGRRFSYRQTKSAYVDD